MECGLHTGFGDPRGVETMAALKAIDCRVCRVSLNDPGKDYARVTPGVAEQIIGEVLDAGMVPFVIIREPDQVNDIPAGIEIEYCNEPEDPQFKQPWFLERLPAVIRACDGRNPLAIPAIANLKRVSLDFLKRIDWREVPEWVMCSHHWYPDDSRPHDSHIKTGPLLHRRRNTRDEDIEDVRAIVGRDRRLVLSEFGFWNGPNHWTPDEVAAHMAIERAFWMRQNYHYAIAFQIDSGPPPASLADWNPGHGFGFREFGSVDDWKPVARAWFGGPA